MQTETNLEPVLLSPAQAAEALGCGRTQVYQLLADKRLRSVKIGRLRRIPTSELHRFVEEMMTAGGDRA